MRSSSNRCPSRLHLSLLQWEELRSGLADGGAAKTQELARSFGGVACADSVTYTPPGASGQIPAVVSGNLTATAMVAGAGIVATSTVDSLSATGFDGATTPGQANTQGNYFTFTLAPLANYALSF